MSVRDPTTEVRKRDIWAMIVDSSMTKASMLLATWYFCPPPL